MNMKKINVNFVLVFLVFFAISFVSYIVIDEIHHYISLINISRGYYGKSQIVFSVEGISDYDVIGAIERIPNVALYKDNEEVHVRQIYFSGKYNDIPLRSGRFFDAKDFLSDNSSNNLAVIGKNRTSEVVESNGQKSIAIGGTSYTVIGVVGMDEETQLDNIVIVKFNPGISNSSVYKLDVFSGDENLIFSDMSQKIKSKTGAVPKQIIFQKVGLECILPELNKKKLYILLAICLLISSITISIEWANSLKVDVAVKRLVGCNSKRLVFEILLNYFKMSLSAGALGMLLGFVFVKSFSWLALISLGISVLFGMIVTIPIIKRLLKVSVLEVIT